MKEAIDNFFIILKDMKDNETLKQSITKSFINTGCAPDPDNSNNYKQYSETSQYSTRGLAVIPKRSSVAVIEALVIENLEENDDPDDIMVEAEDQEDVDNAMTETLAESVVAEAINSYIDELDDSDSDRNDSDSDHESDPDDED